MSTPNPYAAPKAAVADETVIVNADFVPGGQSRPAGNGWTWIGDSWDLFKRQPGIWIGIVLLLTVLFVSPLVFMLSTSFKTNFEAAQPTWIPKDPTAEGYSFIFNADQTPVLRWFLNSLLAATGQALLILITASMAA
ncbi:MAG: hypothetical protein ACREVB_01860, partial [Burkholderiales bacterium]